MKWRYAVGSAIWAIVNVRVFKKLPLILKVVALSTLEPASLTDFILISRSEGSNVTKFVLHEGRKGRRRIRSL